MEKRKNKKPKVNSAQIKKALKKFMAKSIPLSIALLIAFNSTLGVAVIQHYYYKRQMNELVGYKEKLTYGPTNTPSEQVERLQSEVLPKEGIVLPIKWGDIGKRLVEIGVIDQEKFVKLFKGGPLSSQSSAYEAVLAGNSGENIILTQENSRFVLNTLWALGLAQKSKVLDDMQTEYPDTNRLAATGGWTIGKANAMDYYGKYELLDLSQAQQELIKEIASNIYRPCCNNHTAFADCNHGMAMLGLIEMMVAEGYSEDEIYDSALAVNSVWFADTYMTLAKYMEDERQLAWANVDAKEVLGKEFSSGSGYRGILAQVSPVQGSKGGGGCGV